MSHEDGHKTQSQVTESTRDVGSRNQEVSGVVRSARLCVACQQCQNATLFCGNLEHTHSLFFLSVLLDAEWRAPDGFTSKATQHCCENSCHNIHYHDNWARDNLQSAVFQQTAPRKFHKILFKTVQRRHKQQANLISKHTQQTVTNRDRETGTKNHWNSANCSDEEAKLLLCVSPSLLGTQRDFHVSAPCVEDPSPPSIIEATHRRHHSSPPFEATIIGTRRDFHVSAPLCHPHHLRHRRHRSHPSHRHYHT